MNEAQNSTYTKHSLSLENRKKLKISGIKDVESFDEDAIIACIENGDIIIKGENLQINNLNIQSGELCIDGLVYSITYSEHTSEKNGNLFSKIFK